jgi:hypothetical protein
MTKRQVTSLLHLQLSTWYPLESLDRVLWGYQGLTEGCQGRNTHDPAAPSIIII